MHETRLPADGLRRALAQHAKMIRLSGRPIGAAPDWTLTREQMRQWVAGETSIAHLREVFDLDAMSDNDIRALARDVVDVVALDVYPNAPWLKPVAADESAVAS